MSFTCDSDYLPYIAHLKSEHRKIGDVVKRIQNWQLLASPPLPEQSETERIEFLKMQLGSLRDLLGKHFEEEEGGGCIEEAISRIPRLASAALELEAEHRGLLTQLDRLIESATKVGFTKNTATAIRHDFDAFAEELYAHETKENRLLEQGFNVSPDIGERNDQLGSSLAE